MELNIVMINILAVAKIFDTEQRPINFKVVCIEEFLYLKIYLPFLL